MHSTKYTYTLSQCYLYLHNVFCPRALLHIVENPSLGQFDIKSGSSSFITIATNELDKQNFREEDGHCEE